MIVIDTSAVVAILQDETEADALQTAMTSNDLVICAGTYAELCLLAEARGFKPQVDSFIRDLDVSVTPFTAADVQGHTAAYRLWGKGRHPAGLNYGDCFAYALAQKLGVPLAFVGKDFSQTDIIPAIS